MREEAGAACGPLPAGCTRAAAAARDSFIPHKISTRRENAFSERQQMYFKITRARPCTPVEPKPEERLHLYYARFGPSWDQVGTKFGPTSTTPLTCPTQHLNVEARVASLTRGTLMDRTRDRTDAARTRVSVRDEAVSQERRALDSTARTANYTLYLRVINDNKSARSPLGYSEQGLSA